MVQVFQVYHGTCSDIDRFSYEYNGTNTCNNVGGFFFSSDYEVACDYSREAYKRMHEYDDIYEDNEQLLDDHATEQAHVYKCNVTFNNPLILDIEDIKNTKSSYYNVIDYLKMNSLLYLMHGCNVHCSDYCFSIEDLQNASYDFIDLFETYNEEFDEWEQLEPYDGLIIRNACDGISDYSNNTPADVVIALYPNQIKIVDCLYDMQAVA